MLQLFSDLIREDTKEVEDSAVAQFDAVESAFKNTPTWDEDSFNYLKDYTAFKVGEDNNSMLSACLTLEDESKVNQLSDDDIFDMIVNPESKGEKDGVSMAPFKTNAERKQRQNANISGLANRKIPLIPIHQYPGANQGQQQQHTNEAWGTQYNENYPPLQTQEPTSNAPWPYNQTPAAQVPYVGGFTVGRQRGRGRGRGRGHRFQNPQSVGQQPYTYTPASYQPQVFQMGRGRGGGPWAHPYTRRGPPPATQPQYQAQFPAPQNVPQQHFAQPNQMAPQMRAPQPAAQMMPQYEQAAQMMPQHQIQMGPTPQAQQPTVIQSASNLATQQPAQPQQPTNNNTNDSRKFKINVSADELALLSKMRGRHQD